jgi:hypothetical protein
VPNVFPEHDTQVLLVEDQQPVGALFADAANEPFGVAVGPRRQLHLIPTIGIAASG